MCYGTQVTPIYGSDGTLINFKLKATDPKAGKNKIRLFRTGISDQYGTQVWANEDNAIAFVEGNEAITLGAEYTTYCSDNDLDFTGNADVEAYTGKMNAAGDKVMLTKVDVVPAGEGVVLKRLNGDNAEVKVLRKADAVSGNQLVGVLEPKSAEQLANEGAYVLINQQFQKVGTSATGEMPAHKAYLRVDGSAGAKMLSLGFDGDTTGINGVDADANDAPVYDLMGRRVTTTVRGQVYLKNGKKFLAK